MGQKKQVRPHVLLVSFSIHHVDISDIFYYTSFSIPSGECVPVVRRSHGSDLSAEWSHCQSTSAYVS